MQDVEFVQILQPYCHLNQCPPDGLLVECCSLFLVLHYFLVEVAIVRELHYNAFVMKNVPERVGLYKGVLVADDVWTLDRGQNPDLI